MGQADFEVATTHFKVLSILIVQHIALCKVYNTKRVIDDFMKALSLRGPITKSFYVEYSWMHSNYQPSSGLCTMGADDGELEGELEGNELGRCDGRKLG